MFTVNRVTLLGNATHDSEPRETKTGKALCSIGFATDRTWKDASGEVQRQPEYHRLVCFGPLASFSAERVKKGSPLYIEGHLHTRSWEKDGKDVYRTEVIVDRLVLLSRSKSGNADAVEHEAEAEEELDAE